MLNASPKQVVDDYTRRGLSLLQHVCGCHSQGPSIVVLSEVEDYVAWVHLIRFAIINSGLHEAPRGHAACSRSIGRVFPAVEQGDGEVVSCLLIFIRIIESIRLLPERFINEYLVRPYVS